MSFHALHLPAPLLEALEKRGYQTPTPIQTQAIPLIMAGHDLIAQAQTGTGKTAAFALPALRFWAESTARQGVHTLILAPTRELALQVAAACKDYAQCLSPQPRICAIIGGEEIDGQITALKQGVDLLVATPGRLLDLLRQQQIHLQHLALLVIDEADKMLSLGFAEELEALLEIVPTQRQTLLFSATFPEKVKALTQKVLRDPVSVRIDQTEPSLDLIQQRVICVDRDSRGRLLRHLLSTEGWGQTVVFVASKRGAANLSSKCNKANIHAVAFHGDLDQGERLAALRAFQNKRAQVLIATDIAARGLDFDQISHVVNFDLPRSPADYIHRIGRTGRAGQTGTAISLISADSAAHFRVIEKLAGIQLEREAITGFEATETATVEKGAAPVKGMRKSKKDKLREAAQQESSQPG